MHVDLAALSSKKNLRSCLPYQYLTGADFSEVNQAVAMKHQGQLLFRNPFLFLVFQRFSMNSVTANSWPEPRTPAFFGASRSSLRRTSSQGNCSQMQVPVWR